MDIYAGLIRRHPICLPRLEITGMTYHQTVKNECADANKARASTGKNISNIISVSHLY